MEKRQFNGYSEPPTVAVVGLGKVGLPLAVQYAKSGWCVRGCDIDAHVVEMVNAGKTHILEEVDLASGVAIAVQQGLLTATQNTKRAVSQADVVVVIVPVVIDDNYKVDFRAITAATKAIGAGLQPGTLVIYETTLPVGTTSGRLRKLLEDTSELKAGHDFFLAYSPERVYSGHIFRDLRTYPKVVGGVNKNSSTAAMAFYNSVLDAQVIAMTSTDEAEFVKLIDTAYRDVNIALANEFARYADAFGLDVMASIKAANSQPQSHIHVPGIGVGGHCIPVYPYFLLSTLEELDSHTYNLIQPELSLTRSARHINDSMAEYTVRRVEDIVGPLTQQPVLILGVAYRGDVRETAFSRAKALSDALLERGAQVYVDDPLFTEGELLASGYTPLPQELARDIRAIILQADHEAYQEFDFSAFTGCKIVFDGRQVLQRESIESLGMHFASIGDGGNAKLSQDLSRDAISLLVS